VETFPFIILILVQIPLPLSAVFCIFIDLGTDFVPSIAFSYENPELDLMQRSPRNTQRDQLTNRKNFFMAYFLVGLNEVSACMFTYFLILNDYGIRPN
jgi:magnesium-transporting ATPase (P-type)